MGGLPHRPQMLGQCGAILLPLTQPGLGSDPLAQSPAEFRIKFSRSPIAACS